MIRVVDFTADLHARSFSASFINDCVRVLKLLLRRAVERDIIPEYPIKQKVSKEKEVSLRFELKVLERTRFYAAFEDEAAFRQHLDDRRALGPVRASEHFDEERRFGVGLRGDSDAAGAYFQRFRELRDFHRRGGDRPADGERSAQSVMVLGRCRKGFHSRRHAEDTA